MSHDLRNFFFKPTNTFKRKTPATDPNDTDDVKPSTKRKVTKSCRKIVDSDEEMEEITEVPAKVKEQVVSSSKVTPPVVSLASKAETKQPITPASYFANTSLSKSKTSSKSLPESITSPQPLKEQPLQPIVNSNPISTSSIGSTPTENVKTPMISPSTSSKNREVIEVPIPLKKPRLDVSDTLVPPPSSTSTSASLTSCSSHQPTEPRPKKTSIYFPSTRQPTDLSSLSLNASKPLPQTYSTLQPSLPPPTSHLPNDTSIPESMEIDLDSIEIPPVGAENCLVGLTFVQTGEFKRMEREEVKDVVQRYGGRFTTAVSGKTSYLLIGEEPGETKLKKAKDLNTPTLNEMEFYKFVQSKKPASSTVPTLHSPKKAQTAVPSTLPLLSSSSSSSSSSSTSSPSSSPPTSNGAQDLWTEKYKPKQPSEIMGNRSMIERLEQWLRHFEESKKNNFKFTGEGKASHLRGVLISGRPGIGKTTAVHCIAKHVGYHALEFNASDVRNKNALDTILKEALHTRTLEEMMQTKRDSEKPNALSLRHCIIMDEVDGMSAGDRGGLAQLVVLLKKTQVPIICICNDRSNPKLRTLSNYCLDLRFRRPDAAQVRSRLMTICYREKLQILPQALDALVASTQGDVRQILNLLAQYKLKHDHLNYDEAKALGTAASKDLTVGVFDSIHSLLSYDLKKEKFQRRFDHFFTDYDLMPFFVQDNYLKCRPSARDPVLNLMQLSRAADAMCLGNHVSSKIQSDQQWGLMNVLNLFSCVTPASLCAGEIKAALTFPSLLGNMSKISKGERMVASFHTHTGKRGIYLDRRGFRLDFLPVFLPFCLHQLQTEHFSTLIETLDYYFLSKTDMEEMFELGFGHISETAFKALPSTLKSKFTREYNKMSHPVAVFDLGKKKGQPVEESRVHGEDEAEFEDDVELNGASEDGDGEKNDDEMEGNEEALKKFLANQGGGGGAGAKTKSSSTASSSSSSVKRGGGGGARGSKSGRGRGKTA